MNETLEWSALEYEEKDRSDNWFWALGIIVVTSCATALIYSNYFFATLLMLGGVLLYVFAKKKPSVIHYGLNEEGLKIGSRLYPYENIKAFYVQTSSGNDIETRPTLFIKSERAIMPIISIPIEDSMAERIHNLMLNENVPEEKMREHVSEKIMESLGF